MTAGRGLRAALASLVVLGALLVSASAASAAEAPTLKDSESRFPDKALLLTLPERQRITKADVNVTENGGPVSNVTVTSPGANSATMLLIDASLTMGGKPIADAMAAARAFAAQRNPSQRLGIATFNEKVNLLLPFTNDRAKINAALSQTPRTVYGTVVYDAITDAVDELRSSGTKVGTVVLLADGQNVGSQKTIEDAVRALSDQNVRLFSVGLRSPAFDSAPLQRLANGSGGTYAEASSSGGLAKIYDALGYRLANEYIVGYRSLQVADKKVNVAVRVTGLPAARTSYTTPALDVNAEPTPSSNADSLIQSWYFALLVVAFVIALGVFAVITLFDFRGRRLRRRMSQFVEMEPEGNLLSKEEILARLERIESSVERTGLYGRFAERCDIASVRTAPSTLILASMAISAFGSVVLAAIWNTWFILLLPAGPLAVWFWVGRQAKRTRKLFGEQLPDNLDVMAQSTRVGHSLVGALSAMAEGAAEPSRREFRRVVTDEQLGIPLEDALRKTAIRMENRDMDHVALVALLQRETGGASAEVIDQVADNIRGRMEIRRLVQTLTAQGRLARWIVSFMPVVLIGMILLIFPRYLDPLLHESFGIVILAICAVMICAGSYVIKRIVEIKV